ncbi:MAG TPA: nuclear transport factor 2 family protein [Chitinophagaceae bacterium]|nr:nuclear transport factor 2 family protein [Chitinophagaceae bacterium]
MSNKKVVEKYIEGFNAVDHEKILSCLTDDVIWDMPGFFYHSGKDAFDKEIENDAFTGKPVITITRMVEEGNIVIAEGAVKARMKDGGLFDAVFCDVFHFEKDKIKQLTTYLMSRNQPELISAKPKE